MRSPETRIARQEKGGILHECVRKRFPYMEGLCVNSIRRERKISLFMNLTMIHDSSKRLILERLKLVPFPSPRGRHCPSTAWLLSLVPGEAGYKDWLNRMSIRNLGCCFHILEILFLCSSLDKISQRKIYTTWFQLVCAI